MHIPAGRSWRTTLSLFTIALCLTSAPTLNAAAAQDFTFIQATDVHTPMPESAKVIAKIDAISGPVDLRLYGVTVPRPSFVIVTGDLTEFGAGWWQEYQSYWKGCDLPIYNCLGNHDNTWRAELRNFRQLGTNPYYSFDRDGCHFVCLMSATIQDPRPSFGEEEIVWLKHDLKKVSRNTPIFLYFHHPLGGTEFASPYDWYRVLDVMRPYNLVLVLTGHYHTVRTIPIAGIDQIVGGTTFGANAGLTFISVKDGILRVAYEKADQPEPMEKMLEKPLSATPSYPDVQILSPGDHGTTGAAMDIAARISGARQVDKVDYTIDGQPPAGLQLTASKGGWSAHGHALLQDALPGSHYLRVTFYNGSNEYSHSAEFFLENSGQKCSWRHYLAASSKCTPTIAGGVVYVGADDGTLHALRAQDGKQLWAVSTGAEILTQPLVEQDRVYVGNGDGKVLAVSTKGKQKWSFTADDSVYSSPVYADGKVIFGCNDGKLYALDADTGKLAWTNTDATYSIESKPFVWEGKIYYGAWDQYVRCVDAHDGHLIWKQIGEGSRIQNAKRYYSPADAGPVVVGGKAFIADRDDMLTILDARTGARLGAQKGVSATGISEDGTFVYLRKVTGGLEKMDAGGHVLWLTPADLGYLPAVPTEQGGIAFAASERGKVSAISAADGKILWQYQASPQLYVMSSVASDGHNAYVTAFDGYLTAIALH